MNRKFSENYNWYKGNIHSHTTNSDGTMTPKKAVERYQKEGYSFLCLSDHDIYTDYRNEFDKKNFLILPGVEISGVLYDENNRCLKVHHMNGILGTEKMQREASKGLYQHMERIEPLICYKTWNGKKIAQKMSQNLKDHGCYITYNHPVWSRIEPEEFEVENIYHSLEIFNYNTVNESGTGYNVTYWDEMLRKGFHVNADASDDNHNGTFPDSFGAYIMVRAEELTYENILNAMVNGDYYSSGGPEIYQYSINDKEVYIKCSPVERINIIAGGYVGAGITILASESENLTEAHYKLIGSETYIRVECIDQYGKTAWSNPYYLIKGDKG